MSHDIIIRDASIVVGEGEILEGDLAIENGNIERIDTNIKSDAKVEIRAEGKLLLPGVIDPQVHFRDPGLTHKEDLGTGSMAAVAGGVTSFLEMPNTDPLTITQEALDAKLAVAREKCYANYGFFIGATKDNLDVVNTASPVPGIKIFMGSSTGSLLVETAEDLERIFANGDRLIAVHAEDEVRIKERMAARLSDSADGTLPYSAHSEIRDDTCALNATKLAIELSHKYNRRLHILHVSTKVETDYIREHKTPLITAEAIPNHLFLNIDDYDRMGSLCQMNPPIRTKEDNEALWQGLRDGTLDFIATDHAPHTLEEKDKPYPNSPSGLPGVEWSLPRILTYYAEGGCTLREVVRWMSSSCANAYQMVGKGQIRQGLDADLTLVDMENARLVTNENTVSKAGWSPWAGMEFVGFPTHTFVCGQLVFENGQFNNPDGKPLRFGKA